ncbi:glutamine--tRNA ligase/YqeY domain fusion protein [Buchnera aphidicola]|uniref:glutamine--tRNA ligase/YqeY domain fusion protein n=1 Tax=Buchnera aphidicola TaxID=9 RepID=UPI00209224FF|nr:glutamine--tRNA ligase/YqeY domain fusion protein [Buchnera aphidicola]USS94395.1 glutamine--tRNA ligase/YqeY domain fusion protein [Buchnera aphidicola (Sipha maydis)]WII23555.1 glutamine--tRNA ligase/YqeY domain fusion protein [Buchnera aphidicola (Sipha maydis)]
MTKNFKNRNFIFKIIDNYIQKNKKNQIRTRFPPEPNGFLHIGHAKSICLNFNIAKIYHGKCNLRFDDTNPKHEKKKFVKEIKKDIQWMGYKWNKKSLYASQYFEKIYKYAKKLIKKKFAYVDQLSQSEIKKYRGTLKKKGINSPYRNRVIKENLKLFKEMKNGKFKDGEICLRAKINMQSNNIIMRDPVLYRVKNISHYRTKNKWCIYPTYDFSHCLSDFIEKITHSLCSLEFLDNKELYTWILQKLDVKNIPQQYEFSRLNLEYTVLSKRKLKKIVKEKIVTGWDDPRMPTISGLRRRGYTPQSIKNFCQKIGISKKNHLIELKLLEYCVRNDLNKIANRFMAVINPIKIIIINMSENHNEKIIVNNHPFFPKKGKHKIYFSKVIYIDKSDFKEKRTNKYKRLSLNTEVRLRHAYIIKALKIEKNSTGEIKKIFCTYDKNTLNKNPKNRKVNSVIHWISKKNSIPAKFRLFQPIFKIKNPNYEKKYLNYINKNSIQIKNGFIEKDLMNKKKLKFFQFEREGYFIIDKKETLKNKKITFNETISLKEKKYF